MNEVHFFLAFYLLLFQALQDKVRSESCRGERSQRGFALFHCNYSSNITNDYSECLGLCIDDPTCMSLNYWLDTKQCDLNNHSRETCPACYKEASSRYMGMARYPEFANSCSNLKMLDPTAESGNYVIDPDGEGGLAPFTVYCDMTNESGVGVTVISHDSESRTHVHGCEAPGCYSRDIHYTGASLSQLASLTRVSSHCEQFIKYECYKSRLLKGGIAWWVSRDSTNMTYWGGASPGSSKCACGMNKSCADSLRRCNCDKNDPVWREDSGLLTDKTKLPVKQLRFGDTVFSDEQGYHTLGKLKCYGTA